MMRRFAGWLLICCFLLWGPLDTLPLSLTTSPPLAASAAHNAFCRCAACPGGKMCCCRNARNVAEAVILKARCEDPHTAHLAAHAHHPIVFPALPPTPVRLVYGLRLTFAFAPVLRLNEAEAWDHPPCRA